MSLKFYPLRALLFALLLFGIKAQTQAQLTFVKAVVNSTTGGDGTIALQGEVLTYTISITNTGTQNYIAAKLYDNVPPGVSYVTNSTTLNSIAYADKTGGVMPFSGTGSAVNSPTFALGILAPNSTAIIKFKVTVTGNGGSIFNNATIDATQGAVSTIQATNTVYTNIQNDLGCNIIYQTATYKPDGSGTGLQREWSWLRTVDSANGTGGVTSAFLYDGVNGAMTEALGAKAAITSDQLMEQCAAIAYDRVRKRIWFVNNVESEDLKYIDMNVSPLVARRYTGYQLETKTSSNDQWRINRMGMGSDGYCYALTSNGKDLIKFTVDASDKPVITRMGALSNDPSNGSKDILSESGGDLFADGSGKLYLICNSSTMYKINPATMKATYMGKINFSGGGSFTSQSLAINTKGEVYIGGAYNDVYKLDLATMQTVKINSSQTNVYQSGDFTTCGFPVLASSIIADKTYNDIDGDGIINGGDTVEYKITVTNIGNMNAAGVYMYDYIPPSTTYIPGTTKMNGIAKADISGVMPFAKTGSPNGALVNSPGQDPGIVLPTAANQAVVTFRVKTEPNKQVCNQSKISLLDADGNIMFVNSSDPTNIGQTPTCFYSDGVLPLMNLKFKGSLQEQKSVLNWTMNGDDGVATYDVEYSENGTSFTKAGTVVAKENTNIANNYQFTDVDHTFSTTRYYRLKVNQKGGSVNYSGVIRLNINELDVEAVPNPFDRDINVQITLKTTEQVRIRLVDFAGREVYSTTEQLGIGSHSLSVRIPSGLSKGMYMLDVRAGKDLMFSKKLLKK